MGTAIVVPGSGSAPRETASTGSVPPAWRLFARPNDSLMRSPPRRLCSAAGLLPVGRWKRSKAGCVAWRRRRARGRADSGRDGAERVADAAAAPRARDHAGGRGLHTTARPPGSLLLLTALLVPPVSTPHSASFPSPLRIGARLGAARASSVQAAASRSPGRRQAEPRSMSDTVVFVPAWNEEQNLPAVLGDLRRELPDVDVLVVDDGSTDGTAEASAARRRGALPGRESGLPVGIAAGYGWALEHGYAFCGRVDADGQHRALELARLLALVKSDRCDVAVGSRFVSGDGYRPYRYRPSLHAGWAPRCSVGAWASCCGVHSQTRRAGSTRSTPRRCPCLPKSSRQRRPRSKL